LPQINGKQKFSVPGAPDGKGASAPMLGNQIFLFIDPEDLKNSGKTPGKLINARMTPWPTRPPTPRGEAGWPNFPVRDNTLTKY
jgi:hypothetical protein